MFLILSCLPSLPLMSLRQPTISEGQRKLKNSARKSRGFILKKESMKDFAAMAKKGLRERSYYYTYESM